MKKLLFIFVFFLVGCQLKVLQDFIASEIVSYDESGCPFNLSPLIGCLSAMKNWYSSDKEAAVYCNDLTGFYDHMALLSNQERKACISEIQRRRKRQMIQEDEAKKLRERFLNN